MKLFSALLLACAASAGASPLQDAPSAPRAVVVDVRMPTSLPRQTVAVAAQMALQRELKKRGVFDVVSDNAVNQILAARRLKYPLTDEDWRIVARDTESAYVVEAEIVSARTFLKDGARRYELTMQVRGHYRKYDVDLMGVTETASVPEPTEGGRTEAQLWMEAADKVAGQCALELSRFPSIVGQILQAPNPEIMVVNKGIGHGVKGRQEWLITRDGRPVAKARVFKLFPSHTELKLTQNLGGVQPGDRAIALYQDPALR
jgi:hypothetical protein